MKFLAIERELSTQGFSEDLLKMEAARVWELEKAGVIREIYFKKETREAVLILECEDGETAESHLSTLPLVKAQLIEFSVNELVPYDGYERLFSPDKRVFP
ncbi:MAG: hypothetical protein PVF46_04575 [Lysobacterales bacterium]|jgi:hypothetical protein